jgi:hypothetical protein
LTDDHLSPEGFFEDDDKDNLLTAPLCSNCHPPLSKDDAAMRVTHPAVLKCQQNASKQQ